jgi:hypothetical protein
MFTNAGLAKIAEIAEEVTGLSVTAFNIVSPESAAQIVNDYLNSPGAPTTKRETL